MCCKICVNHKLSSKSLFETLHNPQFKSMSLKGHFKENMMIKHLTDCVRIPLHFCAHCYYYKYTMTTKQYLHPSDDFTHSVWFQVHCFVTCFVTAQESLQCMGHCIHPFIHIVEDRHERQISEAVLHSSQTFLSGAFPLTVLRWFDVSEPTVKQGLPKLNCQLTLSRQKLLHVQYKLSHAADTYFRDGQPNSSIQNVTSVHLCNLRVKDPALRTDPLIPSHVVSRQLMYQHIHVHVGQESHNHLRSWDLDGVNDLLYFSWWICSEKWYGILQANAQLFGCLCKCCHTTIAIIVICSDGSNPAPTKVLD